MKKWEYKTLYVGETEGRSYESAFPDLHRRRERDEEDLEKELNRLGNQGWEMVAQVEVKARSAPLIIFKREKNNSTT